MFELTREGDLESSRFLLPKERVLLESDDGVLLLTSHRVMYQKLSSNHSEIITIMLEEIASCAIVSQRQPYLLGVAVVAGLIALYQLSSSAGGGTALLLLVGLGFLAAYYLNRSQQIQIESAGAKISVSTSGMSLDSARMFINETDQAKTVRYLASGR